MASFWDYELRNKINDLIFRGTSPTLPASWYLQLFTVAPTITTAGTQAAVSRLAVTRNTTNFTAGSAGVTLTAVDFDFGNAPSLLTIVGIGLFDASSGGVRHGYGDLQPGPISFASGQRIILYANDGEFSYIPGA